MGGVNRLMVEWQSHIDALKAHALLTDLHLESFLPFQIASISFELCHSFVKRKPQAKLRERFMVKLTELEDNLVHCCDPEVTGYHSAYRKHHYVLPAELIKKTKAS
jgi:hypothetical protein